MFENTLGAFDKIVADVKKICVGSDVALQVIFIAMYVYMITVNLGNLTYLIIYSVLLGIAATYFVFHVVTLAKPERALKLAKKKVRLGIKYFKYILRVFTIGLSVYGIVTVGASGLTVIVTSVTAVCFGLQIVAEISRILIEHYVALLKTGVQMDVEEFKDSKLGKAAETATDFASSPKSFLAAAIDKPLEALASRIKCKNGENETENIPKEETPEKVLSRKEEKLRATVQAYADERKLLADAKKEERKLERKEEAERSFGQKLGDIKEHIGVITADILKKRTAKCAPEEELHAEEAAASLPSPEEDGSED